MKLYEYEAKELLKKYGIAVPNSTLLDSPNTSEFTVVKAQVLTGSRGKAGGVKVCENKEEAAVAVKEMLGSTLLKEKVEKVLVEEKVNVEKEFYVAFTYDTDTRGPVIILSKAGGVDIEEQEVIKTPITKENISAAVEKAGMSSLLAEIEKLYKCFVEEDCRLLEINPLVTTSNRVIALDAMIDLDDDAMFRHERSYTQRTSGMGAMTEREKLIKQINDKDYKGTIKFMELDGDIGFLAAGGGGSITCMDALLNAGGKPANYTEYSGNPSTEKVYELTKVILSKPLKGLWIVGAIANFTKVDATMEGIVKALAEIKPQIPIVVRRSGPNEKEGIELLKKAASEHNLDIEVHGKETPMTATAEIITRKANGNSN